MFTVSRYIYILCQINICLHCLMNNYVLILLNFRVLLTQQLYGYGAVVRGHWWCYTEQYIVFIYGDSRAYFLLPGCTVKRPCGAGLQFVEKRRV